MAYQHKTVATAIRLFLGKLRDDRLQVLPRKKEAIIKTATTFHTKHVRANTYPLSRPPKESHHINSVFSLTAVESKSTPFAFLRILP